MKSAHFQTPEPRGTGRRVATIFSAVAVLTGMGFAVQQQVGWRVNEQAQAGEQPVVVTLQESPPAEVLRELDVLGRETQTGQLMVKALPHLLKELQKGGLSFSAVSQSWSTIQSLEGYLQPEDVERVLNQLAQEHPEVVTLETLGETHEGRPILAAVLQRGRGENRPTVLFNSMHHAREVMTTEVAISIVEEIVTGAESDPEIANWLENYRIVVVPQVNPDGNARVHSGRRFWRKNAYERRGSVVGVDLNRNYPTLWGACNGSSGSTSSDTYRGPQPASEPETKALMNTVARFRPVFDISYHSYSELIIFPYGCRGERNTARDVFESVAEDINAGVVNDRGRTGQYAIGTAPELLYNADGGDLDWQWDEYGVLAYTLEVNSSTQGFQPDYTLWRDLTTENQMGGWKALLRRLSRSAIRAEIDLGTEESIDAITYTVDVISPSGKSAPFALNGDGSVKHFKLRSESGLLFHIVEPGRHRVNFWRNGEPMNSAEVRVGESLTDLGSVAVTRP